MKKINEHFIKWNGKLIFKLIESTSAKFLSSCSEDVSRSQKHSHSALMMNGVVKPSRYEGRKCRASRFKGGKTCSRALIVSCLSGVKKDHIES